VPPPSYTLVAPLPSGGRPAPRFVLESKRTNEITDVDAWFAANGLDKPGSDPAPTWLPPAVGGLSRAAVIASGTTTIGLYGADYAASRVAVWGPNGVPLAELDLAAWLPARRAKPGEEQFTGASVRWAWVDEEVLYLSVAHRTYAASSYGENASVTALDLRTGNLRWQSDPLVCNAANFEVLGDHIVCGYGFTAEPDALVVLDRTTGATTQKIKLVTGPDYVIARDGKLYVRTYNTDYVFAIR
jgi:hypothetical protein